MGSLVLTVGTGSTWAMQAALVLAMSGLGGRSRCSTWRMPRSCSGSSGWPPPAWCPNRSRRRADTRLAGHRREYLHELCPARRLYPGASRAGAGLVFAPSCTPVFAKSHPAALLPRRAPTRSLNPPVEAIGELARLSEPSGPRRGSPFYFGRRGSSMPSMR